MTIGNAIRLRQCLSAELGTVLSKYLKFCPFYKESNSEVAVDTNIFQAINRIKTAMKASNAFFSNIAFQFDCIRRFAACVAEENTGGIRSI